MTTSIAACFSCFLWLCSLGASAEGKCGAELKLLLLPSQAESVVRSFHAGKGVAGEVYFFDTPALELLSRGIIVRVRRGATSDVTVKVRPPRDKEVRSASAQNRKFKCEMDLTGGIALRSYSIRAQFNDAPPVSGKEIFTLLNSDQKDLLAQVHSSIDWSQVKRIAEIKSTDWPIYKQPRFPKLVLELWEWPTGSILELSTRVQPDTAPTAYTDLQRLASGKGLSLSSKQTTKTTLALGEIAHVTIH